MRMKVLLTGGAGYIGSHTCVELIKAGYETVIVDNCSNSDPSVLARLEEICGTPIPFYPIDAADSEAMDHVFSEHSIDAIIHFAGYKAVGESVVNPLKYYRNNLNSALTILELMDKYRVKNIVFSSSATVYGAPRTVPIGEKAPENCTNPYGRTKRMIEQIIEDVSSANAEFTAVILRYFNPIGAHESGKLGDDPNGIPNNLMPYITRVAAGTLDRLSIFGGDYPTRDGTGVRDYIHVVDLAEGHVAAIRYAELNKGTETINLGTGVGYSVLDMIHTFERANQVEVPYQIVKRRPGDVAVCYADSAKARELLGWKAVRNLEDMCKDAWNYQLHTTASFGNPRIEVMNHGEQDEKNTLEG